DLWETNQTSLFEPLAVYSETWPTSGMTRNGTAYELPTSEHHTDGTGSSSLLPTPAASQGTSLRTSEGFNDLGRTIYKLLPTPTVGNHNESGNCRDFGGDLTHALTCDCKLLPTPLTQDKASGPSMLYRNTLELRALDQVSPAQHAVLDRIVPELRGELMSQLSEDGRPLLADQHQSLQNQPGATGNHNSAQSSLNGSWDSTKDG